MIRAAAGIVVFLVTAAAVTFLSNQAVQLWLSFSDPFTMINATATNPRIRAGDGITIRYEYIRHRYCQTDINTFIASVPKAEIVWRNRTIGGATLLGHQNVLNTFRTPPMCTDTNQDMCFPGPGRYLFRTITYSQCSDGSHTQSFPEVEFEVM